MRKVKTEKRFAKILEAADKRQPSLHVVIENIHDKHNVSAIFRSCDAVGVPKISLLYTKEKYPKRISKWSSASASKWVEKQSYNEAESCINELKEQGFTVYAGSLSEESVNVFDLDFTGKTALVFGNEHRGISEEIAALADKTFYIPMMGMVQSLNVAVAAAVTLYEAQRQRIKKGMYEKSEYTEEEKNLLIDKWCNK
ncbi:MAG: RNA methyltransferase [Ignavibacteria bacterium]|nr:RNA methyltransferase [Ignavibacteria bacterium]